MNLTPSIPGLIQITQTQPAVPMWTKKDPTLTLNMGKVRLSLRRVNHLKAPGLDGLPGHVLRGTFAS